MVKAKISFANDELLFVFIWQTRSDWTRYVHTHWLLIKKIVQFVYFRVDSRKKKQKQIHVNFSVKRDWVKKKTLILTSGLALQISESTLCLCFDIRPRSSWESHNTHSTVHYSWLKSPTKTIASYTQHGIIAIRVPKWLLHNRFVWRWRLCACALAHVRSRGHSFPLLATKNHLVEIIEIPLQTIGVARQKKKSIDK